MPRPREIQWTPGPSTAKSLCASTVVFHPGSHVSESEPTPSVIVSTWKDLSTPSTNSEIRVKLDNPIDLTGYLLSPFFVREFHYQGCRFHSIAHLMCYHYAMIHDLKSFATSIRKWSRHLTDFLTYRFQTPDWQVQCRTVLKEIYSHPCLTDISVKTALADTRPRPFNLQCSMPWGGLYDIPGARGTLISEILIEAHVDLAAGRLTSAAWLQPTATRGGLRNAAR